MKTDVHRVQQKTELEDEWSLTSLRAICDYLATTVFDEFTLAAANLVALCPPTPTAEPAAQRGRRWTFRVSSF